MNFIRATITYYIYVNMEFEPYFDFVLRLEPEMRFVVRDLKLLHGCMKKITKTYSILHNVQKPAKTRF